MKIDAHHHFWKFNRDEYPWMMGQGFDVLRKDYGLAELKEECARVQVQGSVVVQARQSVKETEWLLDIAEQSDFILGVVGWVDLCSEKVSEQLERFAKHPKFKGVRHVVQDEKDGSFMQRSDFTRGIDLLQAYDLTYDILIYEHQLPSAIKLVEQFPGQSFVIDHLAKPRIRDGIVQPWADRIKEIGKHNHVYCKISGMVTEADWMSWHETDFKPYLDAVTEAFGPHRLMIGSDWPVCLLAAGYEQVLSIPNRYFSHLSQDELRDISGANADRVYRLSA